MILTDEQFDIYFREAVKCTPEGINQIMLKALQDDIPSAIKIFMVGGLSLFLQDGIKDEEMIKKGLKNVIHNLPEEDIIKGFKDKLNGAG